ncbi:hypothetical protein [Streptomyces sp. NPDC007346]|uniref:hypothetical protein n=1 Tax=Streptomyces sp. NPDC007346 TaxID=3154682 RepID=UPI0034538D7D
MANKPPMDHTERAARDDDTYAKRQTAMAVAAAEMYLAVWVGMRADLAQYVAARKTDDQAAAEDAPRPAIAPTP